MNELKIVSKEKNEMIDITNEIDNIVKSEKMENGLLTIYVPHTTAGITINEGADPSVQRDIIQHLKKIIPESSNYHHMEGNSDAHIKASFFGPSVNVIIENSNLTLGTWQHIFFYEGDGPRNRRVFINFIAKK